MTNEEQARQRAKEIGGQLEAAGRPVESIDRMNNNLGYVVRCKGGLVNVYDKGTVSAQGSEAAALELIIKGQGWAAPGTAPAVSRNIFVVYGHDTKARTQLEAMLRRWQLEPLILDQLPSGGQTIIEKLEKYANVEVGFAVVLATPDDEGFAVGKPDEKRFRARQNVVLELGLLLSKLGRERVAVFLKDQKDMERPSDIQGLIYIPFTDDVEDGKVTLMKEMNAQGIKVDPSRL